MSTRVCAVTGSRADYGLLFWTLRALEADPDFALQLAVTGSHLRPELGSTVQIIEQDGFPIAARFDILGADDSPAATARSTAVAIEHFTTLFSEKKPDVVLLLGDRSEMLAAGSTALLMGIPIAHIHGGERSEGAVDEAIRHSLTKMAQFHFVASEEYRRRVIQLGESPERVWNVGPLVLDCLSNIRFRAREELERMLEFSWTGPLVVSTLHPETNGETDAEALCTELLTALAALPELAVLFTAANADAGGKGINRLLVEFAERHPQRARFVPSLGNELYLSAVNAAAAVVGNSSSGIIEAPLLGVPTVNIGDRQRGRARARSIIDCPAAADSIEAAIRRAVSDEFRASLRPGVNRAEAESPAKKIVEVMRGASFGSSLMKEFYDLPRNG